MAITFEGYERRIAQINKACEQYGIKDLLFRLAYSQLSMPRTPAL